MDMMWYIFIAALFIIASILIFFIYKKSNIKNSLNNLIKEWEELNEKFKKAKWEYASLEEELTLLNKEREVVKYDISILEQRLSDKDRAYEIAQERNSHLELLYSQKQKELDDKLLKYEELTENKKKEITNELEKAESLVKSLNRIYILESQNQDIINENRLNITDKDINDVSLLQNIKYQFSNPRVISKLIWQTYYQPIAKVKFSSILNNQTVTGIYKITNIKNNKIYIGQAVDIYKRWCEHCKCGCGLDTPANNKLYKAMQEDGLYNFRFELLEECPRENLNEKEKYYIDLYESIVYGYNSQGGING